MHRTLPNLTAALALSCLFVPAVLATPIPPGGTLTNTSGPLNYTSGPLTGQNQTGSAGTDPVCFLDTCDDYLLTVSIPQSYRDANPDDIITIQTQWPGASNDFDLYLFTAGGTRISAAATSDNPEIIRVPIGAVLDGPYIVRMVSFDVTNETYTGLITLDPPPPPAPPAAGTQAGVYVTGTDIFSCNVHLTGEGHNGDAEPGVKVDGDGNVFVGSNAGVGGGIGLWKITDACGLAFDFLGAPDGGAGGGDVDIEAAHVRNVNGYYNIYTSSLALANIVSSVSMDGGATFQNTVVSDEAPVNDRQWNARYDDSTIYLSFRTANTGNQLIVYRSDFAGAPGTFLGPFLVYADVVVDATLNTQLGSMVVDQRPVPAGTPALTAGPGGEGNVYHGFMTLTADQNRIYVGVSKDFGVTWTSKLVFQGGPGDDFRYDFSWVTVDAAGNVYTAFSDQHNIYYSVSADQGDHWSAPFRVSTGADNKSAVFVSMDAGTAGRVVFSWYGSSSAIGVTNPLAKYHVFHARCNNALAPLTGGLPVLEQVRVSNHVVHTGKVCLSGITCTSGRELLEDFEVGINPLDGSSVITYTDNGEEGGTYFSREIAGETAIAGKVVTDHSSLCPRNTGDCREVTLGNPCTVPGVKVVTDASGDEVPADEQRDIESISVAEPLTAGSMDRLVFTMKVKRLDPNPLLLPQSAAWRMTWSFAGTEYFIRMLSCPTGVSYDYGTVGTTSTTVGPATAGTYSSDGTISITILKSLVGNPTPGSRLAGVTGLTRIHGGPCPLPPGPAGVGQEVDAIGSSSYTLASANFCALLSAPAPRASSLSLALSGANPFHGRTTVSYALPDRVPVRIEVFSVTGQRVRTLVDRVEEAGVHGVPFVLRSEGGRPLGPGVYLIQISAAGEGRSLRAIALD